MTDCENQIRYNSHDTIQHNNKNYQINSNETVFESVQDEIENIGYYNLPLQDTTNIKEYAKTVCQKHIAIIGVGRSTLGTIAIYNFLKKSKNYDKYLHLFESIDPMDIKSKLSKIDLKDTHFIIISKSETTIETISIFKYLSSLTIIDYSNSNSTIVSEKRSKITIYANKHAIKAFEIPKNIRGRFSVFSTVRLLPLVIIDIDINNLLKGAKEVRNSFLGKGEYHEPIMQKARFLVENKNKFNINLFFSYSSALEGFNKRYIQLWGESLEKLNVNQTKQALTPIGLIGPTDQHSFLQLIEEQANATIQAVKDLEDIPCDVITIKKVDKYNISKLMFSYQLPTSIVGKIC